MWTDNHPRPKTLLAALGTLFACAVILPSPVLSREERPFQPPFLAPAHRSSRSGVFRLGAATFGYLAHSCRAFSNRLRIDGRSKFLALAATAKARAPLPMMRNFWSSETWWTP